MKVYLVRHGQAVAPQVDSSQPLSDEGRNEIEHVARTLNNMNVTVGKVYHSGKLRAEESAMILADALGSKMKKHSGLAPNDEPEEALELIQTSDDDLMIVAHLPLLDRLLRVLVNPGEDDEIPEFGTGTLVALSPSDGGRWQIFRALGPHMIW